MQNTSTIYPPELLHKYPHMFALDIAIWERFLTSEYNVFDGIQYDIKLGTGTKAPQGTSDNYARMQEILSKYRVDAIGHTKTDVTIIEVKPEAGTTAIGQVDLYTALYRRDYGTDKVVKGMIVTNWELPDIRYHCNEKGFQLIVLPDP